jgi:hypothetical protein
MAVTQEQAKAELEKRQGGASGAPSTQEQARVELGRREVARRELVRTGREVTPEAVKELARTGSIRETPGIVEKTVGALPAIGQTAGGVAGAVLGSKVKAPRRGQIAGGVIGRAGGQLLNKLIRGDLGPLSETEKKVLGKDLIATAGSEALTAGVGGIITGAGKGALEALLGKRITERGLKEGFKRFLDPKFYQDRVPKAIVEKTSKFFNKLDRVTGTAVDRAVRAKTAKGTMIKIKPIQAEARRLLKEDFSADTIEDLGSATISKAQKNKLVQFDNLIQRVKQDELSPLSMWKTQKQMDKIRFGSNFDPDIKRYMDSVRRLTSSQIKRGSKNVSQAFGRYSSVQTMKTDLEKKFEATLIEGETFSPKTEQFANTLLGTSKDETVRGLKKLDSFLLNADDKIVEDLLDVAATESLEKNIQLMGVMARTAIGAMGGQRSIAGGAANVQSPGGQLIRGLLNRGVAVGGTELVSPSQTQQ